MLAFLILPVLVSGFIVCNYNPNFYYKIHRYQGQYLYFISACLGVASLLAFSVIAFIAHKFFPSTIYIFNWEITISIAILLESLILEVQDEKAKANLIAFAWIVVISLGTILIAYFWSVCSRARLHIKAGTLEKSKILLMSKVLSDNPMEELAKFKN